MAASIVNVKINENIRIVVSARKSWYLSAKTVGAVFEIDNPNFFFKKCDLIDISYLKKTIKEIRRK